MNKPPYKVPTMTEIRNLEWNGVNVVSTFSGAGGSCTGYRMAHCKVVWANEFVPAAQETYKANAAPDSYLDKRDIRDVKPEDILEKTGLKQGEIDIFDGSPPCQAFSTIGKRDKGWGKEKTYEHGAKQCNEELFFEYIRLLNGLKPRLFIAENVSGLLKGTAKGYFIEILKKMKACGYNVKCRLLDAQWLGVPQQRQRAIFIGVRNDLGREPLFPVPLKYRYTLEEILPYIIRQSENYKYPLLAIKVRYIKESLSIKFKDQERKKKVSQVCSAVTTEGMGYSNRPTINGKYKFTISELKKICAFPDDFVLTGSYAKQWARLGNSVPPVMMYHITEAVLPVLGVIK